MRIAFTSDNHLTTLEKNPERYQSLADIFQQCKSLDVQLLIISGDLFDQSLVNYSDFEKVYSQSRPKELRTIIIPGNHDLNLKQGALAGEGLIVYSEPILHELHNSRQILFLPYRNRQSMGEEIAPFADRLTDLRWILVSHGDWSAGQRAPDPYETGFYMPLTGPDLTRYQPELVFLGHVHLPQNDGKVYYSGSPCPLNISETGLRRFLILDTQTGEVSSHPVNSPLIYFDESFLMLPGENELDNLISDIEKRIENWNLPKGWENQVRVRIKIYGSSSISRSDVSDTVRAKFAPYNFYEDHPPSLDNLVHSQDEDKAEIARRIRKWVHDLNWDESPGKPTKTQIIHKALMMIYQI